MKTLTLIVPCYNEQDVLPLFYEETSKMISGISDEYSVETVYVDDGSKDRTLDIIKSLSLVDTSVKYISFSRNFGKEAAMLAGMEYAVKSDFIGILDADLQHSPDIIPQMLNFVDKEGFDVAAAKREDREGEDKFKSFLSDAFYKIINKISTTPVSESAQDFRVMKSDVVKAILSMPESIRFSKGIFSWVGFNVKWISHENRERAAGQTKWSLRKLIKYAFDGILSFTSVPLKIIYLFSALFFTASISEIIYLLIKKAVTENYLCTVPILLFGIFFTGSVILLSIGITGEYISRIYTEVKCRPKYIIAQTNARKNKFYDLNQGEN